MSIEPLVQNHSLEGNRSEVSYPKPSIRAFFHRLQSQNYELFSIYSSELGRLESISSYEFLSNCSTWSARLQDIPDPIIPIFGRMHVSLLAAWFGSLLTGKKPVFISYPNYKIQPEDYTVKLSNYQAQFQNQFFIGLEADREYCANVLTPDSSPANLSDFKLDNLVDRNEPLFIQCSSGSTGLQKAVAISTSSLEIQLDCYARTLQLSPYQDRIVSWLPLYHDMGLIGAFLLPLLTQTPVVYIDTFEWAANPALLLRLIGETKGTLCWLPNFAFSFLCKTPIDCDLSSVRSFINCSEPATQNAFLNFCRQYHVSPDQLSICYALAENVFGASQTPIGKIPKLLRVNRDAFQKNQLRPVDEDGDEFLYLDTLLADTKAGADPSELSVFCCGPVMEPTRVIIDKRPGEDVGEILLQGPCCISHYFGQNPPRNDGWFPTGDLGFIYKDELYICGRSKDLIIHNGKNIYPQDLEEIVNQHPTVHKGRVVAIGWFDEPLATEKILVLFEPERLFSYAEKRALSEELQRKLNTLFDIRSEVVCVPKMWLRKTSSGKIARQSNLSHYLECRDQVIHVIGDSHSRILWTERNSHRNYYKRLRAHWAGVLWADNWHLFYPFVKKVVDSLNPNDVLVIEVGEPECRSIFPVASDPLARIQQSVNQYERFFRQIRTIWPGRLAYMTGTPTHPQNVTNKSPEWPVTGTPQERYRWQNVFYAEMRSLCNRLDMLFIDACTPFITAGGFMDVQCMADAAHVKMEYRSLFLDWLDSAFGFLDDSLDGQALEEQTWDGTYEHYQSLVKAIIQRLAVQSTGGDYEHLVSSGMLNSLALVEFISELERRFHCRIPLLEVSRWDFESIAGVYKRFIKTKEKMNLNIGGRQAKQGWKILNAQPGPGVDYIGSIHNLTQLENESVVNIYCCGQLQQLDPQRDLLPALVEYHRVLVPGGQLRISVPNMEILSYLLIAPFIDEAGKRHILRLIFSGPPESGEGSKFGFTFPILLQFLNSAGFVNVRKVGVFNLFNDSSAMALSGVSISLNVVADKRSVKGLALEKNSDS